MNVPEFGKWDLVVSALALIGQYCWKLLWPVRLCAYYLFPAKATVLHLWALKGCAALAICGLIFAILWKLDCQAAFGMVWLLATLAPVLNVEL